MNMSRKTNLKTKYSGLSLIEMLITLVIISIILVVTSSTLVALIKASAISSARALSRDESEFVLELLERELKNADALSNNVIIYNTPNTATGLRHIDFTDSSIVGKFVENTILPVAPGGAGNEIHIKSNRYDNVWICMAFIKGMKDGQEVGVIVRREVTGYDSSPGIDCIGEGEDDIVFVSSEEVDVELLEIRSYSIDTRNTTFIIDLTLKPVYWIPGKQSKIKPEYFRQLIVRTGKLPN